MINWSALRPLLNSPTSKTVINGVIKRNMSGHHNVIPLQPSKWQWIKFKDLMNFYILLGVIPLSGIVLATNIFVGPAGKTLTEIPEGYVPKHWETYSNPITRFLARYMLTNPQREYEKFLQHLFEESEMLRLREVEKMVKQKMSERADYQAFYYRPVLAKYHRMSKDAADYLEAIRGD